MAITDLINDMKNQLSVDLLAMTAICDIEKDALDQDSSVTLLACFKYSPYLNAVNINTIMNL